MRKVALILILPVLLIHGKAYGQSSKLPPNDSLKIFYKYLQNNIRYSSFAVESNIQGRVVIELTLTKDQTFTNIKILRHLPACDSEVVRKLENYNNRSRHFNLDLKPGIYKLVVDFGIIYDNDTANYESSYDEKNKIMEFPIIGYPIVRKMTSID